ncbi:ribonuclease H-like domain-containing protein [Tanacetum coccineum]
MISDGKIVDSGANQHMTNNDRELDNVYDISHLKIKVGHPNGTKAFIFKIENLILPNGLVLFDVLVVLEYYVTLISVHKHAKDNKFFVAFDESRCYFLNQDLNLKNVMGIGNQCGRLYYFNNQDLNHINFFDNDYPEMPNDDERVDPSVNSDQRLQSDSSHSSVPDGNVNTADFPDDNLGNDAQSSGDMSSSWPVFQLDVNNAFFYGDLVETVYMKPPEGYFPSNNKMCRLKKLLYGLKQATRQWNAKLTSALTENSFSQSKSDYSLYIKFDKGVFLALLVYVCDNPRISVQ